MSYSVEEMAAIAEQLYEFHVREAHGAAGLERLRTLIKAVRRVYQLRSPQSFPLGLNVFTALDAAEELLDRSAAFTIIELDDVAQLANGATLEVLPNDRLAVWPVDAGDPSQLVTRAVVYRFPTEDERERGALEQILLPGGPQSVRNPNGYPSTFAPPTFWNLEDALKEYAQDLARKSTCKILKTVWAQDSEKRRLVLVNQPEVTMRESLTNHLRSSLRDLRQVRVNEEQMMSETEPVDIQVTWSLTTQIAVIEVKWLGRCLNDRGTGLSTTVYADARAREGAGQLANYLTEFEERVPGHEVQGYLVCFDARRRGVTTWEPGEVTSVQAWAYAAREIDWRDSVPARSDFRPPRRIFLEPRIPPPTT